MVMAPLSEIAPAGTAGAAVTARLRERGVNVSASAPSSTLLDATARGLPTMARASLHYDNSEDEFARTAELVAGIAAETSG